MDEFRYNADSVANPARSVQSVILSDEQDLPTLPKALFVGTGGDIALRGVDDSQTTVLKNVAAGSILPVRALRIYVTGTTAGDIVALV
jgi:hypothetical protein